ncbi:ImmA/IrrE family metallo-endopeptidase [Sporosarcina saromensis]|uniref:ImmA/IrrE family metallo-endopeptidase n=1 Tax=Sporosarcina saromensis TaxID=359365 RepID=A0ABU4GA34_9BACL|nr:ImmA/IrrE family metallo-endopeptidase [Sporosarcina saromensis]MDW0113820.1 ImmA/IrrE family metallo-endopeptidase [Sporosarcina saromensis]
MIIIYIYSHLEDYIVELYKRIGISRPNQLRLEVIAKRLDITVYSFGWPSEALYSNGRQYIYLNRYLTPEQKWQEFAHELCHALRHSGYQKRMYPLFRELQEWQADNFALHFCIPTFMLQRIKLPTDKKDAACLIAKTFHVEYEFAFKRLELYKNKIYAGRYAKWHV